MTDIASINYRTGNAVFDNVTARSGFNVKGTLTTRRITFADGLTTTGNVDLNLTGIRPTNISSPDVERLAYAHTSQNDSVVIQPFGVNDGWDVKTVQICMCPGSGAVQSVDPVTGEITYIPTATFFGTDVFRYNIVDNQGTTRVVFQYVVVSKDDAAPHANNFDSGCLWIDPPFYVPGNLVFPNFVADHLVVTANPIDLTSGVIVSGIWDPSGHITGPTPLSSLTGFAELTFLPNGNLNLFTSPAAINEIIIMEGSVFMTATYSFADTEGNVSNAAFMEFYTCN